MEKRCCSKLKNLFYHPKRFMDSIASEKNYTGAMFFYVKLMIISVILTLLFSVLITSSLNIFGLLPLLNSIISAVFSVGISFATPFIIAGIVHLGVLIFRGKQGYFNTYKPLTYAMSISLVYGILSTFIFGVITLIAPQYSPTIADVSSLDTLAGNSGFMLVFAVYLTILLISLIHSVYAGIIGISKYQKISKLRAFFSIILVPLIIMILAMIIVTIFAYYYPLALS